MAMAMEALSFCIFPFSSVPTSSACSSSLLSWFPLFHLAALAAFLPLQSNAQYYSNDPSLGWPLSDYYDSSDEKSDLKFSDFILCNNGSSNLALLSDEEGLYGKCTGIESAHALESLPYTVYFSLCFVVPLDSICLMERNSSVRAYSLSLVALNEFGKSRDPNRGRVIWTANPEKLVSNNACVYLGEDSNLKLLESNNELVWETNTTNEAINASIAISFEGNLVLFSNTTDPPYVPLWESFRNPTDTLMVLQGLRKPNALRSRNKAMSPTAAGNYTLMFHHRSLVLYARIWEHDESLYGSPYWVWSSSTDSSINNNNSRATSTADTDDDISFAALCWDSYNKLRLYAGSNYSSFEDFTQLSPSNCSTIHNTTGELIMEIQDPNQPTNVTYATFLRLDPDGDLRAYTVNDTTYPNSSSIWRSFYNVFNNTPCQLPLYCGFYGKCDQHNKDNPCTCHTGFQSVDESNLKLGCKLMDDGNTPLQLPTNGSVCASASASHDEGTVTFRRLENVHYFFIDFTVDDVPHMQYDQESSCRDQCQRDCNCTAAFWNESTSTCFLVLGQVGTIQSGTMVAFIKYLHPKPSSPKYWIVVGPVLAMATLAIACISLYIYRRRRALKMRASELEAEGLLLSLLDRNCLNRFTWKQLHEYTCGFSDLLGGGGFGSVFRGCLPDGTAVAVKQLDEDGSMGQGTKEFIAEVSILSKIHHAHLVRLIGFCLEGRYRILVYEFMENKSLDTWLFKAAAGDDDEEYRRKKVLSWRARFQIALGTAKGLAYLHEECEERVIHMDLKPQNILLGRDFVGKISDFGMSRRTGREQTTVMTVMKGTPGYLAPEWLVECAVTEKCDVYSFGIVLLEMVSGRRVRDLKAVKQRLAMKPLRESVMVDFLDERLKKYGRCDVEVTEEEEIVRMVEIALLCLRSDPTKRPAMSSVAVMLEGKKEMQKSSSPVNDDDGSSDEEKEQQRKLVMYPSTMNRTIRSRFMSNISLSFTSFADHSNNNSSSSNSNMPHSSSYTKQFHGHSYKKPVSTDNPAESDTLLDHY